jgi:hypothetical protein
MTYRSSLIRQAPAIDQPKHGFTQVIDNYLPRRTCADLYRTLLANEIPSSLFYVSLDMLTAGGCRELAEYLPLSLAEFIVEHLRRLLVAAPKQLVRHGHGFEIWTTLSTHTEHSNCYLHIDNDESLRTTAGILRAPLIGTVLHIGPDGGVIGGETLFADERHICDRFPPFQFHPWQSLIARPRVTVVPQQAGRLVIFDGRMAHGRGPVIDHPDGCPRITFLANLWDARIGDVPHGLCSLSPHAYHDKFDKREAAAASIDCEGATESASETPHGL